MLENHKLTIVSSEYTIENSKSEKYSTKTSCYLVFKIKSPKIEYLIKNCLYKWCFAKLPSNIQKDMKESHFDSPIYIKVKGCSYCNRDDKYSISTGKKIAYSRAFAKAYKQYSEIISIIEDNFSLIMDELLTNKVRCYKILNNEEYRIDDIIKRESTKES